MISDADRSRALEQFGYTSRQAQFLLLVALHGGFFLRRQYVAFTGRAHGQAAVRFIATTIARDHARALPYGRQGHLFHLCARPLYAAIGQEHNRNRRAAEWVVVIRKLMTLDFVLAQRQARFWATEEDKVALLRELDVREDAWPAKRYAPQRLVGPTTTRYFVDKMPWFRQPDDPRLWFAYVDADHTLKGFETFLGQYKDLLAALPSAVTYVGSGTWSGAIEQTFRKVMRRTINWAAFSEAAFIDYCRLRRDIEADRLQNLSVNDIQRFHDVRSQFANRFFDGLYGRWVRDGDGAVSNAKIAAPQPINSSALRVHNLTFSYGQPKLAHPSAAVRDK